MNEAPAPATDPRGVTRREAFWFWLRLGCTSFGGPAGQIALMHSELVEQRRWISQRRFLHALNYCMLLPGPEAQQLATYLGWLLHRTWGGVMAGALFVLPSLLLLILLSWLYLTYGHMPLLAGVFYGMKPAVAALIAQAALRLGRRTLRNRWLWALAVLALLAVAGCGLPFPLIVAGAAVCGFIGGHYRPAAFALPMHAPAPGLVIGDESSRAAHTRFRPGVALGTLLCGLLLWAGPLLLISACFGKDSTLPAMGWFFSRAALMTFGGAYAVLPYVWQGAVTQYHWLSATQMMDGLALGETTPGPLIMVVAFIGYVGGYAAAPLGAGTSALSGALGAMVATWFTFLPSFLFILLGGPLVEATHGNWRYTAPLTAVTAAVVGVILNLALFFTRQMLWPQGWSGPFEWEAALLGLGAGIALMRYQVGVVKVIAACALAGLLLRG